MKIYPKGSKVWAEQVNVNVASTDDVIKRYEEGFSGVYLDPEKLEEFNETAIRTGGYSSLEEAAQHYGWYGSFANQLVIPFVHVQELLSGAWPGPGQQRGDCVSHSNKNAILGTLVGEVVGGQPDEVTGKLERIPDIPQLGINNGALSTEVSYWYRGHGSDGWFCGAAATVSMSKAGAVLRKNHPEIGIDLTKYSGSLAGRWGRSAPPESIGKHLKNNLIRTAARSNSFEGIRDSLGQGRFISSCGSEGFSKTRDANGVSKRSGSWAHAMGYIATDDRPETVRLYGSPLVLILNSWGLSWNNGPRTIRDSARFVPPHKKDLWIALDIVDPVSGNILIPKGSFWATFNSIRSRDCYVYAGLSGWEMRPIENWGVDLWG